MKKYCLGLVLFLSISLCGCNNQSEEQQIGENTCIIENTTDHQENTQNNDVAAEDILPNASDDMRESGVSAEDILPNVSDDTREGDLVEVGESWEDAYKSIICDIDSNLADPYNYNLGSNGNVYLGIHDFDGDDTPELIIGDSVSAAVFTYDNGDAVKIADLYEPEDWGGINGLYYKDNHIVLVSSGSGGSGYVCFTYDKGEYITGVYDDYNPEKGIINGNQVTGEVFRQQFNLTELTKNSRIEYSKVTGENGIVLAVNSESTTIDGLDFQLLEWHDQQQDDMPVADLTGNTKANEAESLETSPKQKVSQYGMIGNLGLGFLVYTIPGKDDEDYRLYFFESEGEENVNQLFNEPSFNLSQASYTFSDVREGNVPVGKFMEIYCLESGDVLQDGTDDFLAIAVYEKDGNQYYDTRVYEAGEKGYIVNAALTQELNEKYFNVEDYPIGDIIAMPGD